MSLAKLTTHEIEQKIDQLIERTNALADIIYQVKDDAAKTTLQVHQNQFLITLSELRTELERRNIAIGKPSSAN